MDKCVCMDPNRVHTGQRISAVLERGRALTPLTECLFTSDRLPPGQCQRLAEESPLRAIMATLAYMAVTQRQSNNQQSITQSRKGMHAGGAEGACMFLQMRRRRAEGG